MKKKIFIVIVIILLLIIMYFYLKNKNTLSDNSKKVDEQIIINEQNKQHNEIPVSITEQILSGKVDIDEYNENIKNRSINNVTMQVKENTLTRTGATFIIIDRNKVFCDYTPQYKIEVKKNGEWRELEANFDDFSWELVTYTFTKEVNEKNIDWSKLYGTLENGEYRIGIKIYTTKYEILYAELSIK